MILHIWFCWCKGCFFLPKSNLYYSVFNCLNRLTDKSLVMNTWFKRKTEKSDRSVLYMDLKIKEGTLAQTVQHGSTVKSCMLRVISRLPLGKRTATQIVCTIHYSIYSALSRHAAFLWRSLIPHLPPFFLKFFFLNCYKREGQSILIWIRSAGHSSRTLVYLFNSSRSMFYPNDILFFKVQCFPFFTFYFNFVTADFLYPLYSHFMSMCTPWHFSVQVFWWWRGWRRPCLI